MVELEGMTDLIHPKVVPYRERSDLISLRDCDFFPNGCFLDINTWGLELPNQLFKYMYITEISR